MLARRRNPVHLFPPAARVEFSTEDIALSDGWSLAAQSAAAAVLLPEYAQVLGIPAGVGSRQLRLMAEQMAAEAYRIEVQADRGVVAAATEAGFRHALQSLRQMVRAGRLPIGRVEDEPRLGIRGFHTNLHAQFDLEAARRLVESAGRYKLNALVLEYNERFPYRLHERIQGPNAFTAEEVEGLVGLAHQCGLETIPLVQSLGHLEYLLHHDAYAGIREEDEVRAQMCPLNPRSFETFVELAEETLALHPDARFLHVGGDETRQLGVCPKCRERAAEAGLGALYGEHVEKVLRWTLERGLRPIIWDDMLCAHPEALDYVPRETVIMYWEYWTVGDPSPYFVARFQRKGKPQIVHDARWGTEWPLEELPEVQREVLRHFSRPVPLETDLGDEFLVRYGKYLGPDFPRCMRAFPYLEYFQDQGFQVMAAPTAMGNHQWRFGLPCFDRFLHNIHAFAARCRANGEALGLATSSWYAFPPDLLTQGIAATGQFTWADV